MPIQKDGSILINEWADGIASSAYLGFEEIRNCDVSTKPGVLRVGAAVNKESGTTIGNSPFWMRLNSSVTYLVDDNGQPYSRTAGGSWSTVSGNTDGNGNGLAVWKDYLFKMENTKIDVYGALSGTPSWTGNWQTDLVDVGSTGLYFTFIGQDDILYIGGGNQVASLQENSGQNFAPGTAATYTWNANALDLPEGYVIRSISELGDKLFIAANNASTNQSDIFLWDRTSSSFDLPVKFGHKDIHAMIAHNNLIYMIADIHADIYITDGTSVQQIGTLPATLMNYTIGEKVTVYADAIESFRDKVYFATSTTTAENHLAAVWSIDKNGKIIVENTISTGETGQNAGVWIWSIIAQSDTNLLIAWEDTQSSEIGVDEITQTRHYTSYAAYAVTPFYQVGTLTSKKQFADIQIELAKALATNEGVRLSYRVTQNGSWTTIQTFTAAQQSFREPFGVKAENIQFKIELTTPSGSQSTPELISILVR